MRRPTFFDLAMGVGIVAAAQFLLGHLPEGLPLHGPSKVLLRNLLFQAVVVGTCWGFVCRKQGKGWREGFALTRLPLSQVLLAAGIPVALLLLLVLMLSSGLLTRTGPSPMGDFVEAPGGLAVVVVIALTAPFVEELAFRGFLFPVLQGKVGTGWAVAGTALVFVAIHGPQYAWKPFSLLPLGVVALVLTLQRARSGSLTPSLITHQVYDGMICLLGVLGRVFQHPHA